jgi:hypothetical protein
VLPIGKFKRDFNILEKLLSGILLKCFKFVCLFTIYLIKPEDPEFVNTPREIVNNPRCIPPFKVMISFVFTDDALN